MCQQRARPHSNPPAQRPVHTSPFNASLKGERKRACCALMIVVRRSEARCCDDSCLTSLTELSLSPYSL